MNQPKYWKVPQRRRQRAAEHRKQGDGIGVGNAHTVRRVDRLRDAQRPAQGTVPVKQPPGIMLLNILFNKAAAAEAVIGHIQRAVP